MPICPFCYFGRLESFGQFSQLPCEANATAHMCKACANVADIDAKIELARKNLMDMQAERLQLLSEVNRAHERLTQLFPIEIMSNIFQNCLSDLDTLSEGTDGWLASVPLRLSQVSRRWRTISHSIPQLWAILPLYIGELRESSLGPICDVVREWLGHSGEYNPLSIILDINRRVDLRATYYHPIFPTLNRYAARIRHFQIKAAPPILHRLCYLGGNITTLRISCVPEGWDWREPDYHLKSGCGTVVPENLYLDGTSLLGFHDSLDNLTDLEIRCVTFMQMFGLLRAAPHLVSCKFARPLDHSTMPAPEGELLLKPALKHFQFYHRVPVEFPAFIFATFNFPSLQSLCLESYQGRSILLASIVDHQLRTGSKLERLVLRGVETNDITQSSPLARLIGPITGQSLRHLEITGHKLHWDTMPEDSLQVASIFQATSTHFENLRSLKLYCSKRGWVHTLQRLLSTSEVIASLTTQPLSVDICFKRRPIPIDKKTQNSELHTIYHESPPLAASELREMVNTMKGHFISVGISYRPVTFFYSDDPKYAKDITEEILVTLARLLHNSRSKDRCRVEQYK